MVRERTEAWHKPKNGSVFPVKRRSVKQMMWDLIVEAFKKVLPALSEASKSNKKNNSVHPCSTKDTLVD